VYMLAHLSISMSCNAKVTEVTVPDSSTYDANIGVYVSLPNFSKGQPLNPDGPLEQLQCIGVFRHSSPMNT
jgi:hypothetical protein